MNSNTLRPIGYGAFATAVLLLVYGTVLTLVSGPSYALGQFAEFWYFIVSLAAGFGVQVGLYAYLRQIAQDASRAVLGVTGTTSAAAMISCCAHYLVNLLPILGIAGLVTFVAQYQKELFWVGLVFNAGGITYTMQRIVAFRHAHTSHI